MATLEKRGDTFRVVFWINGSRFSRSLSTADETDAHSALARLEDNLARYRRGWLIPPPDSDLAAFLLSDGKLNAAPSVPQIHSLEQLFDAYFGTMEGSDDDDLELADADSESRLLEPNTLSGMRIHANHLKRILGRHFPILSLKAADLQGYIKQRAKDPGTRGRRVRPATIKKDIVTLRTVWNWAKKMGYWERPFPNNGLQFPRGEQRPPFLTFSEVEKRIKRGGLTDIQEAELWERAFLTLPDIEELLKHVKDTAGQPFIYPMFVFAAHTGARRSEMLRAEIDDADLHSGTVSLREKKRNKDKDTTRRVPLSALLQSVLSEWLDGHPGGQSLFCLGSEVKRSKKKRSAAHAVTRDEAHDHFRRTLAGTKWEKLRGWHVFRHSFCSNCAARGIDQRLINAWVGHQTAEMEARYRHLIPSHERSALSSVYG